MMNITRNLLMITIEKNFMTLARFYMREYAAAFSAFIRDRQVPPARQTVLSERFLAGFECRTRSLLFRYRRQREELMRFSPPIPARYMFPEKGLFVMKSLAWQADHLDVFRDLFIRNVNGGGKC
jgi:hypothetical protein